MKERRYVKIKVDMYEDTKFKIIDMKPERDTIFYVWSRLVLLAGKVDLGGKLYFSRSIPYTIETLSIEFNREVSQIKLAMDTFIELEMLEFTEDKVYKVKNFAKHQDINEKDKELSNNKIAQLNNTTTLNENSELASKNKVAAIVKDGMEDGSNEDKLEKERSILLETKKKKNQVRKKKDNCININSKNEEILSEETTKGEVCSFTEGDIVLGKDERVVAAWSFG